MWTDHERKSAQARAFKERSEYILPVRLDATEIPGVGPTVGYLDAGDMAPADVANAICAKLGLTNDVAELVAIFKECKPGYVAHQDGPDLVFENRVEDHRVRLSILMLREAQRADQLTYFIDSSIFID